MIIPRSILLLLPCLAVYVSGFSTTMIQTQHLQKTKSSLTKSRLSLVKSDRGDFPPEEDADSESTVDWDAEWKKVVASEGKGGVERPGKDFYKSEAEIAAIKASNKAAEKLGEASSNIASSMPDVRSLTGDWKFWIAVLAIISVGISLLSAPPSSMAPPSDGSYYI